MTALHYPPEEQRAASALHRVDHSVGVVLTCHDPDDHTVSLRVQPDGMVVEYAGWGWAGAIPQVDNPPPSLLALHVALIPAVDDALALVGALAGVRKIIDQHHERYRDCRVWTAASVPPDVVRWVRGGCPTSLDVPSDEELAGASRIEQPAPDRPEHGGIGWCESAPVGDELSSEDVPNALDRAKVLDAEAGHQARAGQACGPRLHPTTAR